MMQTQNGQNGCDSRRRQMILSRRRRLMKMSHRLRRRRVRHHERWSCVVLSLMEVVHYAPMLMMLDAVENSTRRLVDEDPSQIALSPQANGNTTPVLPGKALEVPEVEVCMYRVFGTLQSQAG